MARKLSRNAPCPCGSGKKYKHCCIRKDFDWIERDDGSIGRSVSLSSEMRGIVDDLRDSFVAQHGREPERIFEGAPPLELIEHWTVEAMKKAGVEPALIYAYEKTDGLLLSIANENKVPDSDIALWDAAIDEYERKHGVTVKHRRLDENDLQGVLANGPQDRRPPEFVTCLPLPIPFSKESWGERRLSDLVNDPACFEFFQKCLDAVKESSRTETYFNMFLLMAHTKPGEAPDDYEKVLREAGDRPLSADELRAAVETVVLTCQPDGALPNAPAAFEFVGFVGDFAGAYAEQMECKDELDDILNQARSLTLLAFGVAVNSALGVQEDIWQGNAAQG